MEDGETINTMYNLFNDIIVSLKGLVKVIGKEKLNRKLLLSLPEEWCPKVTAIEEGKDLATMTIEGHLESLITHDHTLQMNREKVEINKKKKKDLALRILIQEEDEDLDEDIHKEFQNIF